MRVEREREARKEARANASLTPAYIYLHPGLLYTRSTYIYKRALPLFLSFYIIFCIYIYTCRRGRGYSSDRGGAAAFRLFKMAFPYVTPYLYFPLTLSCTYIDIHVSVEKPKLISYSGPVRARGFARD